eukprot:scaffold13700_cov107-Cylindrotheca_fusiformis.AAC.1
MTASVIGFSFHRLRLMARPSNSGSSTFQFRVGGVGFIVDFTIGSNGHTKIDIYVMPKAREYRSWAVDIGDSVWMRQHVHGPSCLFHYFTLEQSRVPFVG